MRSLIIKEGKIVGEFKLSPLPGCAKICVSHGLKIYPEFQGKGFSTEAHKQRLALARHLGYRVIIATIVTTNKKQIHTLRKNHWKEVREFFNPKTGNNVTLWYKDLDDPYAEISGGIGV
jgi:RimJ/RimL family protein N-acetyltransferase